MATSTDALFIIERIDGAQSSFLSEKIGRNFGSPLGGWTTDREQATPYSREKAEALLAGALAHSAPACQIVSASSLHHPSAHGDPNQ